jgi:tetratricopeptide (TPR) repeat protein
MATPPTAPLPADAARALAAARAAVAARRFAAALTDLGLVLTAAPAHREALDLAGFCCFFAGDFAGCERWCRRALELYPDHAYAHRGLALALGRQRRLGEAIAHLETAIRLSPEDFDHYYDGAIVLADAGQPARALALLERGLAVRPERATRAAALLARLRRAAGGAEPGGNGR